MLGRGTPTTPTARPPGQPLVVMGVAVVTIAALYVGAGIFVPLVLAVLLTFALSPVVRFLRQAHLPHIAAVLLTVGAAGLLIGTFVFLVVTEIAHWATEIPKYQQIVAEKLSSLTESTSSTGLFERVASGIQSVLASLPAPEGTREPVPVTIVGPAQGPLGLGQAFLGSLLGPLAMAAIVTILVTFLLLERENFRDRFMKLVSRGDLRTTTLAMTEAGRRVSRYLLVQLLVNSTYGTLFGIGLYFIGIPDALLWGLLAAMFRYIPFVGSMIAAVVPLALAFAIDPQWTKLFEVVALYVLLEMTVTNAVEPRLYGSSTGLSALAVLVAAMFWATLWGPIGLILATPVTVCLVVLGRYVPQLEFLETLLGSEPVLEEEEQLYQRLVSGNTEEAIELAEQFVERSGSPRAFYDQVAIPALRLAESDRAQDGADAAQRRVVAEGMDAVVEEVESLWPEAAPALPGKQTVLCIGGRTELDGAVASMIAQTVACDGIETRVLPPVSLRPQGIGQIALDGIDTVCIAYLGDHPRTYLRFAARHLRRRDPNLRIVACLLGAAGTEGSEADLPDSEMLTITTTIAATEAAIVALSKGEPESEEAEAELTTLEMMRRLARPGPALNDFTSRVASIFEVPIAVLSVLETEPEEGEEAAKPSDLATLRDYVMKDDKPVAVEISEDQPELVENTFLLENGFSFFAGAPLRFEDQTYGALLVFDQAGHEFGEAEGEELQRLADRFVAEGMKERRAARQKVDAA